MVWHSSCFEKCRYIVDELIKKLDTQSDAFIAERDKQMACCGTSPVLAEILPVCVCNVKVNIRSIFYV